MAAKLKESVIHWKKKLERISDEDVILNVIHKLSKIPITLEILKETHIGKCIRNLSKRDDIVGEKALAVLNKWRITFANADNSSVPRKQNSSSVKENVNHVKSNGKSSSKTDVSHVKSVKSHKETLSKESGIKSQKSSSHNSQSSEKYVSSKCNGNSSGSDESSPYTYVKKEAPSKYISYDPHTDVSEGYNPECPDFFPGGKSVKRKYESAIETYEPSTKYKIKEEKVEDECKPKKIKTESSVTQNSNHISEKKEKKHSVHEEKDKSHSEKGHLNIKKEKSDKGKSESDLKKKVSQTSDSKKSKESSENKEKSSKSKTKLKLNSTEEFTSSEVRFEDCLGFNDIVIKKKKSSKSTSQSAPKKVEKVVPVKDKPSSSHSSHHKESSRKESSHHKESSHRKESSNHTVPKKSSSVQKEKMHVNVPKPKEIAKLEEVDIMSTLPQTLPNYRPLPRVDFSSKKKEVLTNEDAILYMSSKREKTAVYSGRRTFYTEVPTLFEFATQVLIAHIDAIEYMGEVPYYLLKPVLEKCTPGQLYNIENFNPHLLDDTHELWEVHCKRDYKLLKPQENETYRELYLRALEEQERKLKSVTANISASMSKSYPVRRQVKLAYVDSVAKPPRDVARKQAKNGTALPVSHPVKAGPSSKASPRPVAPVINSAASAPSSPANTPFIPKKPKVAPLMAKTLKSMRQCFRRK